MDADPTSSFPHPKGSVRQKALKGVVWTSAEIWGSQLSSFIVLLILARLLKPEEFGLVAMGRVFVELMQIFVRQGMSDAIVQREELRPDHLDTAFWINLGFGCSIMTLGIMSSSWVASLFKTPALAPVVAWMSLTFVINSLVFVQEGQLRRAMKFKPLAVRRLASSGVGGGLGIAAALNGFGVWSLVIQQLASASAAVAFLWLTTGWKPGFRVTRQAGRELFSFSAHILGINLLTFLNKRSDDFLIARYLGAVPLGYYSVAYKILLVMIFCLTTVTNRVAFPAFARLQGDIGKIRRGFLQVTRLTSVASFPAFALMGILAPQIVPVVFGPQWIPSIPVMQVLAWIGIVQSISFFNGSVLRAMGKPGLNLLVMGLASLANVIGFIFAVKHGIVAVAAVFVFNGYLFFPLSLYFVIKKLKFPLWEYVKQFLPSITASLLMLGAMMGLEKIWTGEPGLLRLAAFISAAVLIYVPLLILMDRSLVGTVKGLVKEMTSRKTKVQAADVEE